MKIVVVGCGRLGAGLAHRLFLTGNDVVVVDIKDETFINLPVDFKGRTLQGDGLNRGVLERAGIEKADGLAAVTNLDTVNAVVAHIARSYYHVPRVVSRNFDPKYLKIHEAFGLETVSSTVWGAQRIEEILVADEISTISTAGNGEIKIYEFAVSRSWEGHNLSRLLQPANCILVSLTRQGTAIFPDWEMPLKEGDKVQFAANADGFIGVRNTLLHHEEA
jgi:trk system potassium uptake protein